MTQKRWTDLSLRALKPKDQYYEEVDTSGLRIGVQPSGSKSLLSRYRRPTSKAPAKLTHGKFPALSLSAARVAHAEALAAVAAGTDPGESKKRERADAEQAEAERAGDTVERHIRLYLERRSRELAGSPWRQARLTVERRALPAWRGRLVSEIGRRDVRELVKKIAETRPIAGNRALGHVRKFFNELVENDIIAISPCTGLKR